MTTFSDQPLSRRALREREAEAARAAVAASDAGAGAPDVGAAPDASAAPVSAAPVSAPSVGPEPLSYVTQGRAPLPQYDAPLAQPSVAPQQAQPDAGAEAQFRYRDYSPEATARPGSWLPQRPTDAADLEYRTQGRAEVPVPSVAPVVEPVVAAPVDEPVLDEPVFGAPVVAAPTAEPVVAAPPVEAQSSVPPQPEASMTRRELRAWREAHESELAASSEPPVTNAAESVAPVSVAPVSAAPASAAPVVVPEQPVPEQQAEAAWFPPPLIEPEAPRADALASFEAMFGMASATPSEPATSSEPVAQPDPAPAFEAPAFEPAAFEPPAFEPPVFEQPAPQQATPAPFASPSVTDFTQAMQPPSPFDQATVSAPSFVPNPHLQSVQPAVATPTPATTPDPATPAPAFPTPSIASGAFSPPLAEPGIASDAPAPSVEPAIRTSQQPVVAERPRNHWSRQSEVDDLEQPSTGSLMRSVGAAPAANALVLPEVPNTDIISSVVGGTGDLIITGSISLPASLSSTGAHPTQLDESDLDSLLDPGDQQVTSTDSQPVRAIRAVSTHTSSRELIGTINPKRGNRALTALMISAAGMAVVVVTLLVVALTQGVLG